MTKPDAISRQWWRAPDVRKNARAVAEQLFDLNAIGAKRYAALYEKVLG